MAATESKSGQAMQAVREATTLEALRDALLMPDPDEQVGWTDLPTYGGEEPETRQTLWSWDAERMLIGESGSDLEIVPRAMRCECGEATGQRCEWTGPASETVLVEWMPESLRASHVAAHNKGSHPANGSLRLRCERACARMLVEQDGPEWAEIVEE
jgi:hypothetical protein